jgi:hypothetical protein
VKNSKKTDRFGAVDDTRSQNVRPVDAWIRKVKLKVKWHAFDKRTIPGGAEEKSERTPSLRTSCVQCTLNQLQQMECGTDQDKSDLSWDKYNFNLHRLYYIVSRVRFALSELAWLILFLSFLFLISTESVYKLLATAHQLISQLNIFRILLHY